MERSRRFHQVCERKDFCAGDVGSEITTVSPQMRRATTLRCGEFLETHFVPRLTHFVPRLLLTLTKAKHAAEPFNNRAHHSRRHL